MSTGRVSHYRRPRGQAQYDATAVDNAAKPFDTLKELHQEFPDLTVPESLTQDEAHFSHQEKTSEAETAKKTLSSADAFQSFLQGVISPITNLFGSPLNFVVGCSAIGLGYLAIQRYGSWVGSLMSVTGIGVGVIEGLQGLDKLVNAKNAQEQKDGFHGLGGAFTALGTAALPIGKLVDVFDSLIDASNAILNAMNLGQPKNKKA